MHPFFALERQSALKKSSLDQKTKEKWSKVTVADFMSSEESASGEDGEDVIMVKQLPWRAEKVDNFFYQLDQKSKENKTPQARRQRKARIISDQSSDRHRPDQEEKFPSWSFVKN